MLDAIFSRRNRLPTLLDALQEKTVLPSSLDNLRRLHLRENPDAEICTKIEDRLVNFCQENPDNEGCVRAKQVLQNRVQALARIRQIVTRDLEDLTPEAMPNNIPELGSVSIGDSGEG